MALRVLEYLASVQVQATAAQIAIAVHTPGNSLRNTKRYVLRELDALIETGAVKAKGFMRGYAYRHASTPDDVEVMFVPTGRPLKNSGRAKR